MNSLSVAVAKRPMASLALTAELAAAGLPALVEPELLVLALLLCLRVATTPVTTAAMIAAMRTGTPNLIQLLRPFLRCRGAGAM